MAIPKANQRAVNKYIKKNYDRITITMPKGKKQRIQTAAAISGLSVNAFINEAIEKALS